MNRIDGVARLVNPDRSPAGGVTCVLQVFRLTTAGWQSLAKATTDAEGNLRLTVDFAHPDQMPAPNVRLVRTAGSAVLSEGGRITYQKRTGLLSVEFGEIVNLPAPVIPVVLDPRFGRTRHAIGGVSLPVGGAVAQAGQLPQLETQLRRAQQTIDQLTGEVRLAETLRTQLTETRRDLTQLNQQVTRIPELERGLEEAQRVNEELRTPRAKQVTMSAMAANIGDQIAQAQQRVSAAQDFALANVRVHVKGIVEQGGTIMTLPDAADLSNENLAAGLGDVYLDFHRGAAPAAVPGVAVPDLRRLTEGAARQVLHSLGLRLEPVKGPPAAGGVAAGQASLQAPAAGEGAERGATVTVVFAS